MSNDKCQCGCEPSAEPRPYGFAEALWRHHEAKRTIPIAFTQEQADTLWTILQERAECMADNLAAVAEHFAAQELADIVHRALHPAEYTEEPPTEWLWAKSTSEPITLTITIEVAGGE